ncbi:hypothetical protein DPMN_165367 [Dreissena polymorpha]|uniref:Uncharacterized protein n=1 Tax=Dreissena polymorpha TaxID=45954 RepID=A0A9D4F0H1_DREPO|nr:hypothetical protein DPMN_165367 [Dreissena polymorpha]
MPSIRGTGTAGQRGGGLIEGPRGGGTQYAQRTWETVPGIEATADGGRSGHKVGAARGEKIERLGLSKVGP